MKSVRQLRRLSGRIVASRCVIFEAVDDNLSLIKLLDFNLVVNFIPSCFFLERRDLPTLN